MVEIGQFPCAHVVGDVKDFLFLKKIIIAMITVTIFIIFVQARITRCAFHHPYCMVCLWITKGILLEIFLKQMVKWCFRE